MCDNIKKRNFQISVAFNVLGGCSLAVVLKLEAPMWIQGGQRFRGILWNVEIESHILSNQTEK